LRNIEVCVFRHQKSTIYLLTPWFRDLLEKLTGLQLVKKLSAFHGTRSSITAITSVRKPACECFLTEFFYREGLLAPRPTPKLEDHPSSSVRDCLFNLFAATLLIGSRSSIRNLRTRHAVMTGTHYMGGGGGKFFFFFYYYI